MIFSKKKVLREGLFMYNVRGIIKDIQNGGKISLQIILKNNFS